MIKRRGVIRAVAVSFAVKLQGLAALYIVGYDRFGGGIVGGGVDALHRLGVIARDSHGLRFRVVFDLQPFAIVLDGEHAVHLQDRDRDDDLLAVLVHFVGLLADLIPEEDRRRLRTLLDLAALGLALVEGDHLAALAVEVQKQGINALIGLATAAPVLHGNGDLGVTIQHLHALKTGLPRLRPGQHALGLDGFKHPVYDLLCDLVVVHGLRSFFV